jgi:hypothetical protein
MAVDPSVSPARPRPPFTRPLPGAPAPVPARPIQAPGVPTPVSARPGRRLEAGAPGGNASAALSPIPPEIQGLLASGLAWRVRCWQQRGEPHYDLSPDAAAPMWQQATDAVLHLPFVQLLGPFSLLGLMRVEVERGARVLAFPPASLRPGALSAEARQAALAAICRRLGQLYRLLARRVGADAAQETLWRALLE